MSYANREGAKGGLSGAASGAVAGSMFGPIGMGLGALAGGLGGFFGGRKAGKQKDQARAQAGAIARIPGYALGGQQVGNQYGLNRFNINPGAGVSETEGLYGPLGAIGGYKTRPFTYRPVRVPGGMSKSEQKAYEQAEIAKQIRQHALQENANRASYLQRSVLGQIGDFRNRSQNWGDAQRRLDAIANKTREDNTRVRARLRGVPMSLQAGIENQAGRMSDLTNLQREEGLRRSMYDTESGLMGQLRGIVGGIQNQGPSEMQVLGMQQQPLQMELARQQAMQQQMAAADQQSANNMLGWAGLGVQAIPGLASIYQAKKAAGGPKKKAAGGPNVSGNVSLGNMNVPGATGVSYMPFGQMA